MRIYSYGQRFISFTNLHFDGLHPDMQPGPPPNAGQPPPLGEWQSGIVLACYLQGLPARDCRRRFTGKTYERLGFFEAFARSAETLRQRDSTLAVRFADELLGMARHEPILLTLNHPTSRVFAALASRIAAAIGLGAVPFDPASFGNQLYDSLVWPIYPEIAETHGLHYATPFRFKPPGRGEPDLDLDTFITASYASYDTWDPAAMRERFAPLLHWAV